MENKIQYGLNNKNIVGINGIDYILQDDSDGNGAYIAKWDEFKLGLKPGYSQLAKLDTDPAFTSYLANKAWVSARNQRNKLLNECDWTQLGDSQLIPIVQASWLTYRQALRDITAQTDPNNITWPTKPV